MERGDFDNEGNEQATREDLVNSAQRRSTLTHSGAKSNRRSITPNMLIADVARTVMRRTCEILSCSDEDDSW